MSVLRKAKNFCRNLKTILKHLCREPEMFRLVDDLSRPISGAAEKLLIDYLALNEKNLAAALAELTGSKVLSARETPEKPFKTGLKAKVATQSDMESDWFRYWMKALGCELKYHRKYWEYAFVSQVLYENDMLLNGRHGLGLGCGREPLPCFFASQGCNVTAGDQPYEKGAKIWDDTAQYTNSFEDLYKAGYMAKEDFQKLFTLEYVDMNDLPRELYGKFDFCWSICAVEHLGSIQKGLDFLAGSVKLLKSGGISVHTTEFNYMDINHTVDNCGTVLFKKSHFEYLESEVRKNGGVVTPFDFNPGDGFWDKYIDLPPYPYDRVKGIDLPADAFIHRAFPHIKLNVSGFPATNIGIIIKKA